MWVPQHATYLALVHVGPYITEIVDTQLDGLVRFGPSVNDESRPSDGRNGRPRLRKGAIAHGQNPHSPYLGSFLSLNGLYLGSDLHMG